MTLTTYSVETILRAVPWTIEVTEEFERWWDLLTEEERISIDGMIRVLEAQGSLLGDPYAVPVAGSRIAQLRQLRVPHDDQVICVLFVLDQPRAAVVLLSGSIAGTEDEVCPPDEIETAATIYTKHLTGRQDRQ
jgi:hypothetical protein